MKIRVGDDKKPRFTTLQESRTLMPRPVKINSHHTRDDIDSLIDHPHSDNIESLIILHSQI